MSAEQVPPTPNPTQHTPSGEQQEASANESHKKSRTAIYFVVSLVVLLLLGGGAFLLWHENNKEDESIAYNILENNDNPQDYKDFLEKYPQSPHAPEVQGRLKQLEAMLQQWGRIALSENANDFVQFKMRFSNARYAYLCDIKIDSLDFIAAQRAGTEEAFLHYLAVHPDGRYASEASIAQGNLRNQEVTLEEQEQVINIINDFFHGFETQDETLICSNISATMASFLSQKEATKATVVSTIKGMFNEHIKGCRFIINRDIEIVRQPSAEGESVFVATFTVDQHIDRDNEGKTFGSYKCVAQLTPQLLIHSLVMQELSKQ